MTPGQRAKILFGTEEPVEPTRHIAAGPLSVKLDRGNLRYVCWHGVEVLRGIAFVLRDASWGTYVPTISRLLVSESADTFEVSYGGECDGSEGDFAYSVRIEGNASGALEFRATGTSSGSFLTCRTGFVVLHPLDGVAGQPVDVTHSSGTLSVSRFPELVAPDQPIFDIRELAHSPRTGWTVRVRMEGDAFEMEDHRNWTDASFKTYVRPLAKGYPYRIAAGEEVKQSIAVSVSGAPPARAGGSQKAVINVGKPIGTLPRLGLFVEQGDIAAALATQKQLRELAPAFLTGRVDVRLPDPIAQFAALRALAGAIGARLALQAVIPALAPEGELAPLAAGVEHAGELDSIHVVAARDLKSRLGVPMAPEEATQEAILAAARRAFPGARLAGGTVVPFAELNRSRPPPGTDLVVHATQANVHAADDISVMETIEALPHVIRSVRAFAGPVPYRLGPSTIGTPRFTAPGHVAPNPDGGRITMAGADPRQTALFGAAFALGLLAVSAAGRLEGLTFASAAGTAGILGDDGSLTPAAVLLRYLSSLGGAETLDVEVDSGAAIHAVGFICDRKRHVLVGNLSAWHQRAALAKFRYRTMRIMDARTLSAGPADWAEETRPDSRDEIDLDPYALVIVDEVQ